MGLKFASTRRIFGRLKGFSSFSEKAASAAGGGGGGTAYRYLRVLQTVAQASGYLECQRCDLFDEDGAYIVPVMTSNTAPSPTVVSASEEAFGSFAWQAFTRTTSNRWHSNTPSTAEWLQVDLGAGNSARPAAIGFAWNTSTARFMPAWKVQGSATGSFSGEEEDISDSSAWGNMTSGTWKANGQIRIFWFDKDYSVMKA